MRIGIFGGSFNPVHVGHLIAAECAREQAGLDRVLFVPAALPPHKQDRTLAPAEQRVEMLHLAVDGHEAFAVSTIEIDRGGVSWTVETLAALRDARPDDDLVLLLGPDAVADLPGWREPERIADRAELRGFERETLDDLGRIARDPRLATLLGADGVAALLANRIRLPAIGIRASDLRAAVAAGRSIRYRTPRAVERYIAAQGLYHGDIPDVSARV
ncbi:putative nicotinate-nucleotide adenylyltransferase [Planctomycetia bacterium]|jgi:nicotinate-nucleotide adenylyltransferase|nr:putative nicotinate-nucleotide adenylyltransferase [Planctomycetia bacterium]